MNSIVSLIGSNDMRSKKPKLVVLHQNICSLRGGKKEEEEEFEVLCSELKHVDVICLTEHWQSE